MSNLSPSWNELNSRPDVAHVSPYKYEVKWFSNIVKKQLHENVKLNKSIKHSEINFKCTIQQNSSVNSSVKQFSEIVKKKFMALLNY